MRAENKFNIHQEFFIIDSENLKETKSKLYGFALINNTVAEDIQTLGDQDPKGNGSYICVRNDSQTITIHQDFIGSYGLYLFEKQDYFAISNSFIKLLDHIKKSHRISFNQDFANYMISSELCSASYCETMVNEIELLDRSAVISIDIHTKQLHISYVDYRENTIELNSPEGIAVLDKWYHKWTGLIQNLYRENSNIQIDLSGGFDSRIILTLFLGSGIDMNNVYVNSIKDQLHTHSEDYEIASAISEHYGFTLNNSTMLTHESINYSMDDSINISFYLKLCFHKQMYPRIRRYTTLRHYFGGSGGECVRDYWNTTQEEYIQKAEARCSMFASGMNSELKESTRKILTNSFNSIQKKFRQFNRPLDPEELTLNLYRETRCRNHFGKDLIENYYGGSIKYAPLLDPDLHKLKLNDAFCKDKNLLMAVIFDRYSSDLLSFQFDSNRSVNAATIQYAKELNSRFPYIPAVSTDISVINKEKTVISTLKNNNPAITLNDYKEAIQEIFHSERNRAIFELLYGEELYESISKDIRTRKYQPMQNAYTVIGISKIAQDVLANQNIHAATIADSFRNGTLDSIHYFPKKSLLNDPYLANYITLRLDIKNTGIAGNDLEILEISDKHAKMLKPAWLAKLGNGYTVESKSGKMELTVRCIRSGNLTINVRGRDVRDNNNERIPFWIDLHSFSLNDESTLDHTKPIWHDEPYHLSRKVEDQEILHFCIKWGPHNECQIRRITMPDASHQNKPLKQKLILKIKALFHFLKNIHKK